MFKILTAVALVLMVGCTIKTHHKLEKFFKSNKEKPVDIEEEIDDYSESNIHFGPGPEVEKKSWWPW